MNCNKKVFVFSYCFPNETNPQSGIFILNQCQQLAKLGLEIVILNVVSGKTFQPKIVKKKVDGLDILECTVLLAGQTHIPRLTIGIYYHFYYRLYKKALSTYGKPDVMYAHFCFPTGFAVKKLSDRQRIPFVVMEHSSMFNGNIIPSFVKKQMPSLIKDARAFMCVSESLKKSICSIAKDTEENIRVAHNAIDSSFDYTHRKDKKDFVVFSAGNLVPIKQYDILICAIEILLRKGVIIKLRIAGEGKERVKLEQLVDMLNVRDNVSFLGRLPKEEIYKELEYCDAFALASKSETFGVAFREAMFVGRPVISFDNGGIREGWRDDYGLIVEEQTPEAFAHGIEMVINHYDDFDLKFISQSSRECFSVGNICPIIIQALFTDNY